MTEKGSQLRPAAASPRSVTPMRMNPRPTTLARVIDSPKNSFDQN